MLVFISDLHLSDGTSGANIHPGAFHIFAERLRYLAARASWRANGMYRPVDGIDLVLLGDGMDMIRSQRWLDSDSKPWDDIQSPSVTQTVTAITDDILTRNEPALTALRAIATQGAVCIAPASRELQPHYNAPPQPLPVRIFYMVGNSDWMLHAPGRSYNLLRQKLVHRMALANPINEPFPHDPRECSALQETFYRHRVVARHGDVLDPLNFAGDRDTSSLADVIVIELINRFVVSVQQQLQNDVAPQLLAGLRELDNVRPVLLAPVFLEGLLERTSASHALRSHIKQIWDRLAEDFLQMNIVRQHDAWSPLALTDGLQRALKFSKRQTGGWAAQINAWLNNVRGAKSSSFCEHALSEPEFRNRRARHIVYGHTHQAEMVPLDASFADGYVLNQVYFNTGTWRRVYQPTQWAVGDHEFIPAENMNFLAFFEGDERGGRPFEMWNGTLGVGVEQTNTSPAGGVPLDSHAPRTAVAAPIASPHFAVPTFPNAPQTNH